jgi:membrane-bound metal-dependent hydrolase YbcI (DUF457 family)
MCLAASPLAGVQPTAPQIAAGAVIAAGAALVPDVDHPGSTAARSLGPVTRVVARIVSYVSDAVRDSTCGCCATDGTHGHRTLTHTLVFAVLVGVGVCAAGWRWGATAGEVTVGVGAGLAVLGLLARRGVWVTAALTGAAAGVAVRLLDAGDGWWWLGIPAGWGVLAHAIGDGLTRAGVPLLWPLRIRGCRWRDLGPPRWLRFRTGGAVEAVLSWLMVAGGVAAGWALLTG